MSFESRVDDGTYRRLAKKIDKLPSETLAHGEASLPLTKRERRANGNVNWISTEPGSVNEPKRMLVFGQAAEAAKGTTFSARGKKPANEPISDDTNVKFQLVIEAPTAATDAVDALFSDQVYFSEQECIACEDETKEKDEKAVNGGQQIYRKPWTKGMTIILTSDNIYKKMSGGRVASTPIPFSGLSGVARSSRNAGGGSTTSPAPSNATAPGNVNVYEAQGEGINATYHVDCLPDHRGDKYKHVNSRVRQLDFRSKDGELVKPWDTYVTFRPGTLVLAVVTLVRWNIVNGNKTNRTYQFQIESLTELAPSPLEPEPPVIPELVSTPKPAPATPRKRGTPVHAFTLNNDDDEDEDDKMEEDSAAPSTPTPAKKPRTTPPKKT